MNTSTSARDVWLANQRAARAADATARAQKLADLAAARKAPRPAPLESYDPVAARMTRRKTIEDDMELQAQQQLADARAMRSANMAWGGGGNNSQTTGDYVTDPTSSALVKATLPFMKRIFDVKGGDIYEAPPNLYDIPQLTFNLPQITDYVPGGQQYENVYNKLAPTFWDSYQRGVENPLVNRFAGSGVLGSPVGGLSGAAMDTLLSKRGEAENQISAQAYQSAQTPLLTAYGTQANAAYQQAIKPWEAQLEEMQYPYQILPGVLGGSMPTRVVKQPAPESSGGGGK